MKKRTLNRHFKAGILLCGIPLFFWNCATESVEYQELEQNTRYQKLSAKEALSELEQFNGVSQNKSTTGPFSNINASIPVNKVVDEQGTAMYTFMLHKNVVAEKSHQRLTPTQVYYDNLFVNIDSNGNLSTQILRFVPSNEWLLGPRNIRDYSGHVQFLSEDYHIGQSLEIHHGEQVNNGDSSKSSYGTSAKGTCSYELSGYVCAGNDNYGWNCTLYFSESCGGGSTEDYPNPDSGGYSGGGNDNENSSSGGGGSGSGTGGVSGEPILGTCLETNTCEEEDNVFNNLTGKANCVYEKLKSINGNLFKSTIGAFIDDPEYNLTLQVGNCKGTYEGCTNAKDPKNIIITIENVNQSSLGLAALILHEGIHAEMHRYVSRYESGVDPNNRARLLQLYTHYMGWAKRNNPMYSFTNYAHHAYMVENYVKKIASAVRQIDRNRFPLSHYMAYGWEGLEESGYAATRLTAEQEATNINLKQKVENGFSDFCK